MVIQTRMSVEMFDEFIRQPENIDREFEYIGGEVVEVVSNPKSSKTAGLILIAFGIYLRENDIGHVTGADGGYQVSGERYIPDVAFISYARQPELSYTDGYNPNPPDLAVEVISPGNTDDEITLKVTNYLLAGTVVWLVRVKTQTVEVYLPGQRPQVVDIDGVLDGGTILPGFRLPVKDIFPPSRTA